MLALRCSPALPAFLRGELHAFAAIRYIAAMNDTENATTRDAKTGRFLSGGLGGPGRPRGNRNLLSERYLADLKDVWETHGRPALVATAINEPGRFCQIYASLLPRELDIEIDVTVRQAETALSAYRTLKSLPPNELKALHAMESADGDA